MVNFDGHRFLALIRRSVVGFLAVCVLSGGVASGQTTEAAKPEEPQSAYERKVRDEIDAAGPYDERAIRRLQLVENYIADERWDRALEMLSYALDEGSGELVRLADGQLVPVVGQVHRLLRELPDEVLTHWRRQYEAVASGRYQEGVAGGKMALVEQVAKQFRLTRTGREAVQRLVRVHADRGEFALAARYLRELDPADVPVPLRLRGVRIWIAVNSQEQAKQWLEAIPAEERDRLAPAAGETEVAETLSVLTNDSRPATVVSEWRQPFGDSVGYGLAPAGTPLLLERWSRPLTQDVSRQSEIVQFNDDVQQRTHAIIPAPIPLVMPDRVVARMWGRVCAYDLASGRLMWETASESAISEEDSTHGTTYQQINRGQRIIFGGGFQSHSESSAGNSHPLADSLYRDGVTGLITADTERVYLIEPVDDEWRASHSYLRFARNQGQPLVPRTNELHAFDIETGRPAWRQFGGIGGDLDLGAFERPLAGYYFFGPPTPVDGELYVVGEKDSEIALIALDPASGTPRWSRRIATAPRPISGEPVRQNWNAQVSESEGILICPTTVGWLVAVDKVNHALLWAYRYSPVDSAEAGRQPERETLAPPALDQRWGPSAPIIVNGRVIFTPPEERRLVCLDLVTGELEWKQGQASDRYVAGVANDRLIVVGPRSVDGIDPATRSVDWSYRIPTEFGYPTGRGILSDGQLLLPTERAVLTISTIDNQLVKDGRLIGAVELAEGQYPLGNLALHDGALVSLAADGLTVYEERGHYLKTMEHVQSEKSSADRSRYMRARLSFAEGRLEDAAKILDTIDSVQSASERMTEQVGRLRWDVLVRLVHSDPGTHPKRLAELEKLAESPADRLVVRRLHAASLAAKGHLAAAAERYLKLLADAPAEMIIEADGPGRRTIRLGNWGAGKILDLWNNADTAQRDEIEAIVRRTLAEIETPRGRASVLRLLSGLPFVQDDLFTLAREAGERDQIAQSELGLLRLLDSSDSPLQMEVHGELVKMARNHHLEADAEYWESRQRGIADHAKTESAETLNDFDRSDITSGTLRHDWSKLRLSVLGNGNRHSSEDSRDLTPIDARLPFFQQFRVQLFPNQQRLTRPDFERLGEADNMAPVPLPLRSEEGRSGSSSVHAAGHVLFLALNGVVQAVSLIDGRVLWSWNCDDALELSRGDLDPEPMQTAPQFLNENGLMRRSQQETPILVANANYVLVQGTHRLTALDAISGEVRWACDRPSAESGVVGTDHYLCVMSSFDDLEDVQVLRAIDGAAIEMPFFARHAARSVDTVGDCLLTLDWNDSIELLNLQIGGRAMLALHDPNRETTLWSRTFDPNALFARGDDGTFFVLSPGNGELVSIDPLSGRQRELGTVSLDLLNRRSEAFLLTDLKNVYVMVNQGHGMRNFLSSEFTAIGVNGTLFAFDRHAGGLQWQHEIDQQRLLVQSFAHMPILFFATGDQKRVNNQTAWQARLLAIEKSTGQIALAESVYLQDSPMFRDVTFDPARGTIEISYYSARIRVAAKPPAPAPVEAPRAGD